jgi:hypothetical protein
MIERITMIAPLRSQADARPFPLGDLDGKLRLIIIPEAGQPKEPA